MRAALLILILLLFTACKDGDAGSDAPPKPAPTPTATPTPVPTPEPTPTPVSRVGELAELESGVSWRITADGGGRAASEGDRVEMHLLVMDDLGTKLWEGEFSFVLGTGQAVAGLDEAVRGMQPGESRRILVPWQQGYGELGNARVGVPPKQDLHIEATARAVEPGGAE